MQVELSWHIGKEGTSQERLDIPPYKAYFYWKSKGRTIRSAEYTKVELQTEIQRRKQAGEEVSAFEQAFSQLA